MADRLAKIYGTEQDKCVRAAGGARGGGGSAQGAREACGGLWGAARREGGA
jgi:hypothetical protein